MKQITLFMTLLAFTFGFSQAQKTDYADFSGIFGGVVYTPQSFTFPTGAEAWGGFANENTAMYPLSFENAGEITFTAPAEAVGSSVHFKFEYLPYPNVDPSYTTASHTIVEGVNTIDVPSQGSNTFSSFLLYVETPDVALSLSSIAVTTFDIDGVTPLSTNYADFSGIFGGVVYTPQSFTFPTGAEAWGGFANENTAMYPLSFENAGEITFTAPAEAVGSSVHFKFEYLPYPNVDPSYTTASHTIVEGVNTIAVPSQGSNTFSSFLLYVETPDVALSLSSIAVTSDDNSTDDDNSEDGPSSYYAEFSGIFGGVVYTPQSFTFPTGAEAWGGFANENTAMYPLSFENGGQITFTAPAEAVGSSVNFKFEYQPYPNVDPSYTTASHTIVEGVNTIAVPSQGSNTFSSFLLYVETPDVTLELDSIYVTSFDVDGSTPLMTEYALFSGIFGGAQYTPRTFEFPTGAEAWGGFANENTAMYPLSFENGGQITFTAPAEAAGSSVNFKFEYQPYPNVDPSYTTASHTIVEGVNTIAVPSQGSNTFSSFLLYVETPDVELTMDLIKVTSNGASAGLEDNVFNTVKMFPNPAKDYVRFSTNSNEDLDIQIFDMLGKAVLRVDNVRNAVNVSGLNSGLYFVQMTLGTQKSTKKLVIN